MTTPYISSGNRKMSLPTWSLPAGKTCPGCTKMCVDKCYARKAERVYPQVMPSRQRNLEASKGDGFVEAMVAAIRAKGRDWFRVHESGDFYSQEYLDKWLKVCGRLPGVRFLAFTKSFHLDFGAKPENLSVVWSVWPDTKLSDVPAGPRSYAGECKGKRAARALECPGSCDGCLVCWSLAKRKTDVHFAIH